MRNQHSAELQHQIKHSVEQQTQGHRPLGYGHLASYDPKTSRARFIMPSYTDDGVDYVLSSWAPLHTGFTGTGGWGIQCAPIGGATKQNPTAGELCILNFADRQYGVIVGANLVANTVNVPPNQQLKPGEVYIKGKAGQTTYMDKDGNVTTTAPKQINMTIGTTMALTAQTSITLKGGGTTLTIDGNGVTIQGGHLTHNGKNVGSDHVHIDAGGAGDSGPPA